jgi:hypothetical protein
MGQIALHPADPLLHNEVSPVGQGVVVVTCFGLERGCKTGKAVEIPHANVERKSGEWWQDLIGRV